MKKGTTSLPRVCIATSSSRIAHFRTLRSRVLFAATTATALQNNPSPKTGYPQTRGYLRGWPGLVRKKGKRKPFSGYFNTGNLTLCRCLFTLVNAAGYFSIPTNPPRVTPERAQASEDSPPRPILPAEPQETSAKPRQSLPQPHTSRPSLGLSLWRSPGALTQAGLEL
jgi:hypothetical protein